MAIRDVAGVFSRYFVVGFFLPAFFAGAALDQLTGGAFVPPQYDESPGTRLLIVGGIAVLGALLLTGLHASIVSVLSGQVLWPRWLHSRAVQRRAKRFRELRAAMMDDTPSAARTAAAWSLAQRYPRDESQLLPTRLGNANRAVVWQTDRRWSLDAVAVWPRVQLMLTEQQLSQLADARTDSAFLVNGSVATVATGTVATTWLATHGEAIWWTAAAAVLAVVLAWLLYELAVAATFRERAGVAAAAIDLYRLDLYKKLGFDVPSSEADARAVASCINQLLDFGEATAGANSLPGPSLARGDGDRHSDADPTD